MYLPVSELQTYRGQLTCQYCMMDLKDEQRRMEERGKEGEGKKSERYASELVLPELCERCGRDLNLVYYFNGKRLCSTCVQQEKDEWKTVGSDKPPMAMFKVSVEKSKKATIVAIVNKKLNEFFGFAVKKFIKEDEQKTKAKQEARLKEKIGSAKDSILVDSSLAKKTKKDLKDYTPEEPDVLPKKEENKKSTKSKKGKEGGKSSFDKFKD